MTIHDHVNSSNRFSGRCLLSPCIFAHGWRESSKSDRSIAPQRNDPAHVRFGSKPDIAALQSNVRFTPKSGHELSPVVMSALCQKRTHAIQQKRCYSITSSARPSREIGTVMPSVFAVLRLI